MLHFISWHFSIAYIITLCSFLCALFAIPECQIFFVLLAHLIDCELNLENELDLQNRFMSESLFTARNWLHGLQYVGAYLFNNTIEIVETFRYRPLIFKDQFSKDEIYQEGLKRLSINERYFNVDPF